MIRTARLSFAYPRGATLNFPDVDVKQGRGLLLRGPSGCGKSTWLALVAGLVAPNTGELTVAQEELSALHGVALDQWRARAVGVLPQRLHLSAALTVRQNLAVAQWAGGQREDNGRIDAALQALGVLDLARRLPQQLSGGQAQRVALARAVLREPQVILADEPTASLDDEAAADAISLLLETCISRNATLVIATHDARVSEMIATRSDTAARFNMLLLQRPAFT